MRFLRSLSPALLALLTSVVSACQSDDLIAIRYGTLDVTTATTGADLDPDGYTLRVDSEDPRPIGVNASLTAIELSAGDHGLLLEGMAENCRISEANPRTITVVGGGHDVLTFRVTCTARGGTVEITTATSGVDRDPDGYTLRVDSEEPRPIGTDTSLTDFELSPGDHSLLLEGIAENCQAGGENPRTVSVMAGSHAVVSFQVTCGLERRSRIAFLSFRDGEYDIYTMRTDGSALTNLTADLAGWASTPTWAPDGSKIAFEDGSHQVYVMNADGSGRLRVSTRQGLVPSWAPDGRELAISDGGDRDRIFIVKVDGSGERFLTTGWTPVWSPDGTRIVFSRDGRVFVINADGTGEVSLTTPGIGEGDGDPRWSPDGTMISFVRSDEEDGDGFYLSNLWVINADGGSPRALTDHLFRGVATLNGHAWSPDGSMLGYAGHSSAGRQIFVVRPDGTGRVQLTEDYYWIKQGPAWSPDGTRLLYYARPRNTENPRGGPQDIFVMGADGGNVVNLTEHPAIDSWPAWQP